MASATSRGASSRVAPAIVRTPSSVSSSTPRGRESCAGVPAATHLGISPWLAGLTVLLFPNIWILPYQGLEYLLARDATGGEAFDDRQGTRMGAALTVVRFASIALSVPDADAFPGYYSMEIVRHGKIVGMLSVNASSGAVWNHWWHGSFVAK